MFLKNTAKIEIGQIKHKIPILKHVFQGISRLPTHHIQCVMATVSAKAASPVILMLWKLYLFVNMLLLKPI